MARTESSSTAAPASSSSSSNSNKNNDINDSKSSSICSCVGHFLCLTVGALWSQWGVVDGVMQNNTTKETAVDDNDNLQNIVAVASGLVGELPVAAVPIINNHHSNHNNRNTSVSAATEAASSSSMSISDLVPLSMSVLRDKMMTDLIAEHEALKMKEITGRHGDPVYFKKSMKGGVSVTKPDGRSFWDVFFGDNDDDNTNTIIPNFIETVAGLEVRVSGVVALRLEDLTCRTYTAESAGFTRNDTPQMGGVSFTNDNRIGVLGRVGPILYEDYINLSHSLPPQGMKVTELVRFLKNLQTNNNNDTVLLPQLKIERVYFLKSQIPGVLSLLEDTKGGRSTSE